MTLEIFNLPSSCKSSFSGSGIVVNIGDPIESDQYEKLPLKDELMRIDAFLVELMNDSETQGYIIMSFKHKEPRKLAENRVKKLLKHLKRRGFPAERISFLLDKSQSEDGTALWRFPKNNEFDPFEGYEIIKISK